MDQQEKGKNCQAHGNGQDNHAIILENCENQNGELGDSIVTVNGKVPAHASVDGHANEERSVAISISFCKKEQELRQAAKNFTIELRNQYCWTRWKHRGVRHYYENQVHLLNCYEDDRLKTSDTEAIPNNDCDSDTSSREKDAFVAKIVFIVNVCLLFTKIVASYLSDSLSIISTVLDTVMDLISGVVVWMTMRAIMNSKPYMYPRGRTRLEPISVIIVSILMGIGNLIMIFESVSSIINKTMDARMGLPSVAMVISIICAKSALYWLCARRHSTNSDVLAVDQRNDVFSNLVALVGALIGTHLWPYADPLGAITICAYIAVNWFWIASGQVSLLSGSAAGPELINRIIKLSIDHSERIKCLDTALAYHFGNDFLVELHVVMDEATTTHREAHDIAEPLQYKLERLSFVERTFIHCDWEVGDDFKLSQKKVK